jgi:hypothetical protein
VRAAEARDPEKTFRFRDNQPTVWFHRTLAKSNHYCLYCSRFLADGAVPSNEEHVIGRSFVPDGSFGLGQEFNFIFRACMECNSEKATAERHVSSVTLFLSPGRAEAPEVDSLARRKASRDYHPIEKGKVVAQAFSQMSVEFAGPGFRTDFSLVGPPRLDPSSVKLLAFRQTQAFFSLVTSRAPQTLKGTWLLPIAHWWYAGFFPHSDWGNSWLSELARRVRGWEAPAEITTAGGFFRALLMRDKERTGEWFWALEWNKSVRVIGGIAGPGAQPRVFNDLPALGWRVVDLGTRVRVERPLEEGDDDLFGPST